MSVERIFISPVFLIFSPPFPCYLDSLSEHRKQYYALSGHRFLVSCVRQDICLKSRLSLTFSGMPLDQADSLLLASPNLCQGSISSAFTMLFFVRLSSTSSTLPFSPSVPSFIQSSLFPPSALPHLPYFLIFSLSNTRYFIAGSYFFLSVTNQSLKRRHRTSWQPRSSARSKDDEWVSSAAVSHCSSPLYTVLTQAH